MSLVIKGELVMNSSNDELTFNDITEDYSVDNVTGWGSINKARALVLETQIRITKPDGTIVDFTLDSTTVPTTDFVPKEALTRAFTLSDLDLSEENFPDGVYVVQYICWIAVDDGLGASYVIKKQTVSGEVLTKLVGTSSTFTTVLTGFGDTSIVRVIKASDATEYEDFSIRSIVDNTNITLDQDATEFSLVADGATVAVNLRAGYKSTFAFLNKAEFLACFLPKIAGVHITGTKGCGDPSCATYEADKKIADLTEMHLGLFAVEAQLEYGMWDEANKNMRTLTKICTSECSC